MPTEPDVDHEKPHPMESTTQPCAAPDCDVDGCTETQILETWEGMVEPEVALARSVRRVRELEWELRAANAAIEVSQRQYAVVVRQNEELSGALKVMTEDRDEYRGKLKVMTTSRAEWIEVHKVATNNYALELARMSGLALGRVSQRQYAVVVRQNEELSGALKVMTEDRDEYRGKLKVMTTSRAEWIEVHKVATNNYALELARMSGLALGRVKV